MIVRNRFPEIVLTMQRDIEETALRGAAEAVAQAAKARVPVESGDLRDAIHTERVDGGWAVVAGDRSSFYGHFIEFGTVNRGPHPFLVPALEESRGVIVAGVAAALRRL